MQPGVFLAFTYYLPDSALIFSILVIPCVVEYTGTLFWPRKGAVYNTFEKRSREFKAHPSNAIACTKRHHAKGMILLMDHATCHKMGNAKKFIREHPMPKVKFLPRRAPRLDPVEKLVNAPMKPVVCPNRGHRGIEEVITNTHGFFREYIERIPTLDLISYFLWNIYTGSIVLAVTVTHFFFLIM